MLMEFHMPQGELGKYIENIVYFEGYTAEYKADKLLPDGGIFLIMNMLETPERLFKNEKLKSWKTFNGSFISGQHKSYIYIEADHASNMTIKFKLGGAAAFLNFPISEMNNKVQQAEPLFGKEIEMVRKKIISEKNISRKFELAEEFYLSKIRKDYVFNSGFHEVLNHLALHPEEITAREMASQMGISQKHLISLFNKQVGLTPKALIRIFRFQKVIQLLEKKEKIDWMQVATDCGYYDQAHFIKDFYNFSGIRPTLYPDQKGDYVNFIPVK